MIPCQMFILSSMSALQVGNNINRRRVEFHMVLKCFAANMRWNIDFTKHLLNVK